MYQVKKKKKSLEEFLEKSKKHSLTKDTILEGRRHNESSDLDEYYDIKIINIHPHSNHSKNYDSEYERHLHRLREYVYENLKDEEKLEIPKLSDGERIYAEERKPAKKKKPSRDEFNNYYRKLVKNIEREGFSYCEVFVELCGYFIKAEPNREKELENQMKRLPEFMEYLEKPHANAITRELSDYIKGVKELNYINELD